MSGSLSLVRTSGALGLARLIHVSIHCHLSCHPKDLTDLAQVAGRFVPLWAGQGLVAETCCGATNGVGKVSLSLGEAEPPPHPAKCSDTYCKHLK